MERLKQTRAWIAANWDPCVAVISSPEADSLCEGPNRLSLVNLLRPFGVIHQLNGTVGVPVRTVGEAPLRLQSWRLRFYASNFMFQPTAEDSDARLQSVLSEAAALGCEEELPSLKELTAAGNRDPTPWYKVYRQEFMRLLAFGEQEAMDNPVACLLVLPSTFPGDLLAGFEELYSSPGSLPPLLPHGVMESQIPKHYVLLHDASTAPQGVLERAQQAIHQLSRDSGHHCHLLVINSRSLGQPVGLQASFWDSALPGIISGGGAGEPGTMPTASFGNNYGAGLSELDVQCLSEFVRGLAVNHIIPNLEMRVRALNHQVTLSRKGLRNQLKSLLWRKSGPSSFLSSTLDSPASLNSSTSTLASNLGSYQSLHSSVEGEMRVLSDLSLMLRDYDTALSTLRLLASDFKQDKAWKHYAAVQEALGATIIMMGGSHADAAAHLKEAFYRYQQYSQSGGRQRTDATRYATRTAMILAEFLRAVGQYGEASWAYMKAHFQEDNLRAGLFLEQAAYCLLRLQPAPHIRKFAFHLVLAGLRYNLCGQKGLALRAYKQVEGVYSGRQWALIEEHLHDVLGRQSREGGDWCSAVQHYMAMTNCPTNASQSQRAYLAQFLEVLGIAEKNLGYLPTLELPLPTINLERVGLQYNSQTGYGTQQAREVDGEAWRSLEAAVQPASEGGPITWLDGGSRANFAHQQPEHSCVVGETVGVDVEVSNPLQIELTVSRLRLVATLEATAHHAPASAEAAPSAGACREYKGAEPTTSSALQVREESLTLAPNERILVNLRVVPLRAGSLNIEGVAWTLSDVAHGQAQFRIPRPMPRKQGRSKPQLDVEHPEPEGIQFTVLPPLPHLEVSTVNPLPSTLLVGEIACLSICLKNTGAMAMSNISMAVSSPDILLTAPCGSSPFSMPLSMSSGTSVCKEGACNGRSFQADRACADGDPNEEEQLVPGRNKSSNTEAAAPNSPASAWHDTTATEALANGPKLSTSQTAMQLVVDRTRTAGVTVSCTERPGGVTVFNLTVPGNKLGVGQEVKLLLWLRPQSDGLVRFNCLWFYEPVVKLDLLKFRTLRATYSAMSQPALNLSAAAIGGRLSPGTYLLQLRAINQQGVESVRLRELSCPGDAWQLSDLRQQSCTQGGVLDMMVGPEAAANLHFCLTPTKRPALEIRPANCKSSALMGPHKEAVHYAVLNWFFWRGHPAWRLRPTSSSASAANNKPLQQREQEQNLQQQQQQVYPCTPVSLQSTDLANKLAVPVDVKLEWDIICPGNLIRVGFLALYQQRVQQGTPIHAQLVGPHAVGHDFTITPFCATHLLLRLSNMLPSSAEVVIDVGKLGDGVRPGMPTWSYLQKTAGQQALPSADYGLQSVRPYVWSNRTRTSIPMLAGFATIEIPLSIAVSQPGSISVEDYVVSWSYSDVPAINGSVNGPACLFTVEQAGQSHY